MVTHLWTPTYGLRVLGFGERLERNPALALSSQLLLPHYITDQCSLVARSVCQTPG